jgi:hypothetical protein
MKKSDLMNGMLLLVNENEHRGINWYIKFDDKFISLVDMSYLQESSYDENLKYIGVFRFYDGFYEILKIGKTGYVGHMFRNYKAGKIDESLIEILYDFKKEKEKEEKAKAEAEKEKKLKEIEDQIYKLRADYIRLKGTTLSNPYGSYMTALAASKINLNDALFKLY